MKGFAGGLLVGLVVSAGALTGLSLLAPAPQHAVGRTGTPGGNTAQAPVGATPVVVAEGADPAPIAGGSPPATATDPVPEAPSDEAASMPDAPEPAPEIAAEHTAEPPADVSPVPAPTAEAPGADPAAANLDAPGSEIPADAQPAPEPDSVDAPAPPLAAEEQVALAEPAPDQPAPPQAVPEAHPLPAPDSPPPAAPEANPQPQDTEPTLPEPAQAGSGTPQPDANAPMATSPEPSAPEAAPLESGTPDVATLDTATPKDAAPTEPQALDPTSTSPSPETTQAPEPAPTTESPPEPAPAPDTLTPDPAPPQPTLPGTSTVRVNRLGAEPAEEPPVEEPEPEALPEDAPALLRYAATFEPPAEDGPLVSLILLDEGQAPADAGALAAMPVPVSVALDPSLPDAAERLAVYRAAGIEALLVASLPDGALPQDAAVFLEGGLRELPETVALLDLGQGGLNARNATASMGLSMAARDGRGVVLVPQGFNAGLAAAQIAGIPAAEIQRDLDGEGQDAMAIRRGLDDAVRRAGQEGEVVLLGRIRPGTLDAVTEWTSQGRAQEVTVAPVSALLAPTLPAQAEPPAP